MTEPAEPTTLWVLAAPTPNQQAVRWYKATMLVLDDAPGPFQPPPPIVNPPGPPGPPTNPPGGTS